MADSREAAVARGLLLNADSREAGELRGVSFRMPIRARPGSCAGPPSECRFARGRGAARGVYVSPDIVWGL